jgi:addiction module HigA family antidote
MSHPRSRISGRPVHPGEILRREFLVPFEISQNALARGIGVSPRRINEIVHGKRAITAQTALGLGDALGTSPHFWLALQADYDLEIEAKRCRPKQTPIPLREIGPTASFDDAEVEEAAEWTRRW